MSWQNNFDLMYANSNIFCDIYFNVKYFMITRRVKLYNALSYSNALHMYIYVIFHLGEEWCNDTRPVWCGTWRQEWPTSQSSWFCNQQWIGY